jgi:hypothetical protein
MRGLASVPWPVVSPSDPSSTEAPATSATSRRPRRAPRPLASVWWRRKGVPIDERRPLRVRPVPCDEKGPPPDGLGGGHPGIGTRSSRRIGHGRWDSTPGGPFGKQGSRGSTSVWGLVAGASRLRQLATEHLIGSERVEKR